jgi:hypothetical protein
MRASRRLFGQNLSIFEFCPVWRLTSDRWQRVGPRRRGIWLSADSRTPRPSHNDLAKAELGYPGHKFIEMSRFSLYIDYILCTRRAETVNIGEWTIQAPIPESLWDRQSEPGGKRWD